MRWALSLATFVFVALLVASASYRVTREEPKPASPKNRTEVAIPPNPGQAAPENPQMIGQQKAAPASPVPATASPAPAASQPASPAPAARSSQPAKPPMRRPTAASARAMPAEGKMSAASRRKVQKTLHRRGYYQGPVDGIFGPQTRAAIRRFQDSIGAKSTGYLNAVEGRRLVSTSCATRQCRQLTRRRAGI
jgi:hypothetical protein